MKVQVIYSSLSGCTRRVAEGIYNALQVQDKSLHDLAQGEPVLDGDVVLLGYWVDRGGPNAQMKAFMEKIEGKKVSVFCTLAYWADSNHAVSVACERCGACEGKERTAGRLCLQRHDLAGDDRPFPQHGLHRPAQRLTRERGALGADEGSPHALRDRTGSRALQ